MVYIAADKHGYKAILMVEEYLKAHNMPFENLGVKSADEEMKLEDMIPATVQKVKEQEENKGILICGTGVGVEVGANKFSGIRACLATNPQVAEYSAVYDKCNVLCLVGWNAEKEEVDNILAAWFGAEYDGNQDRLKMIATFDTWH